MLMKLTMSVECEYRSMARLQAELKTWYEKHDVAMGAQEFDFTIAADEDDVSQNVVPATEAAPAPKVRQPYAVGDLVQLRSGGTTMTVQSYYPRIDSVSCVWLAKGERPMCMTYHVDMLRREMTI